MLTKRLFFLFLSSLLFIGNLQATELGVYFYVDQEVLDRRPWLDNADIQVYLNNLASETNESYRISGVDLALDIVGFEMVDIDPNAVSVNSDAILGDMQNSRGVFSNSMSNADTRGADYIYTVVHDYDESLCGQAIKVNTSAWLLTFPRGDIYPNIVTTKWAVATSKYSCGFDTFSHELGHTMGLAHGDQVAACHENSAHSTGINAQAKGWANWDCDTDVTNNDERDEFGTIMVGNYIYGRTVGGTFEDFTLTSNPKTELFSNPNITHADCGPNDICGDATNGNAAGVLNQYKLIYAGHESADARWLDYSDANLKECLTTSYNNVEVVELTSLSCLGKSVRSVGGIEQLTSLRSANLSNNNISVLTPLIKIAKARPFSVNLTGNDYAICHQLDELENSIDGTLTKPSRCFNLSAMVAINSLILN